MGWNWGGGFNSTLRLYSAPRDLLPLPCPRLQRLSTYACAWGTHAPRLPTGKRVGCEAQFLRQLFPADPVGQKVQRFMFRLRFLLCHCLLRFAQNPYRRASVQDWIRAQEQVHPVRKTRGRS